MLQYLTEAALSGVAIQPEADADAKEELLRRRGQVETQLSIVRRAVVILEI